MRVLPAPVLPAQGTPEDICDDPAARSAAALLERSGVCWQRALAPRSSAGDALATALMDLFRRTGSKEAFEILVALCERRLRRRVRARTRYLGEPVDAEELVQDAIVNIYRYPDRFDASRPGAFRAWSTTIVDNAIRRHLRRRRSGPDVRLRSVEVLAQEPDLRQREPDQRAMQVEAYQSTASAFRLFLWLYLLAYQELSERERFVLQMVEVRGMRYAEVARVLTIRPEALKMVVFRARRRILARIGTMLPSSEVDAADRGRSVEHDAA